MDSKKSLAKKRILVTCGPVWTRIDSVRVISNTSSGTLGHQICKGLVAKQARVTLLQGPVTHAFAHPKITLLTFEDFPELSATLTALLRRDRFDAVIHAAAVSDYQVQHPSYRKLASHKKCITLKLVPTPKLILRIKKIQPHAFLVGFKLQSKKQQKCLLKKARTLMHAAACDLVVANISTPHSYHAYIVDKTGAVLSHARSREHITRQLITALEQKL